jgi:hypothetical protein
MNAMIGAAGHADRKVTGGGGNIGGGAGVYNRSKDRDSCSQKYEDDLFVSHHEEQEDDGVII